MMNFIRSLWFTIHYCHHRITNRSQNLFGTDLLVDRLEQRRHSGDQKRLLRERYLPYPKHKKKIDSNKLEIGACLKQTKIDIKLPYRWSRLLFFSFLLLPIIPENRPDTTSAKITTKQLPRESNVKRCHNKTFDRKPVKLSSSEVVLRLETLSAGSFVGTLFASLVVLLCTLLIHLKKSFWRYIRKYITRQCNKKAVFIIPLAWLGYSLFRGLQTQLFIIYF